MATQLVPENLNTAGARLPTSYEAARTALAACASVDECQTWANKAAALASYARQADDDTLHKTAIRIQSRAVRRCGELLSEIDGRGGDRSTPAAPANDTASKKAGAVLFAPTRSDAAREAGMSTRQQKTAVRVANLPADQFEAAVESDQPPTVTALADMGKRARAGEPTAPGFQEQIELLGHARRLADFASRHPAAFVGGAVADYNRRELRGYVAKCRRYLDEIAPLIRRAAMGYERTLSDEINRELNRLQADGQRWVATWITQAIIKRHEGELTDDADFWRHCGYASTREAVRRAINARAGDRAERAADDRQALLPGYQHLQTYYLVKRRGSDVGVPIGDMTDREIDEKITRYEAMSVACRHHAEEFREFKRARRAQRRRARKGGQ